METWAPWTAPLFLVADAEAELATDETDSLMEETALPVVLVPRWVETELARLEAIPMIEEAAEDWDAVDEALSMGRGECVSRGKMTTLRPTLQRNWTLQRG